MQCEPTLTERQETNSFYLTCSVWVHINFGVSFETGGCEGVFELCRGLFKQVRLTFYVFLKFCKVVVL